MLKLVGYNLLLPIIFILYCPSFVIKLIRRGNVSRRFFERFGWYSRGQKELLRSLRQPVWVHAVSVGEVVAATTFIQRWRTRDPDLDFVLSASTTTGHATAAGKLPPEVPLIYCPLDFPWSVARVLRLLNPRLLVLFELEVWPNLVTLADRRAVPVALVNGRLSDKSARGYYRNRWFFRSLFARLSVICTQSQRDCQRFEQIVGSDVPLHVCSTMKFDQVPEQTESSFGSSDFQNLFGIDAPVLWAAASTHAGEEELVARSFQNLKKEHPELKLILVPRHHERTDEVEAVLRRNGLTYRLRKPKGSAESSAGDEYADVLLVNTTGELQQFLAACDIVFMGKSLAGNSGGHNIIEPALLGKPVIHGPRMDNFQLVTELFRESEAAYEVERDEDLEKAVHALVESPEMRTRLGRKARAVVDENRGAVDRTIDLLQPLIQQPNDDASEK